MAHSNFCLVYNFNRNLKCKKEREFLEQDMNNLDMKLDTLILHYSPCIPTSCLFGKLLHSTILILDFPETVLMVHIFISLEKQT